MDDSESPRSQPSASTSTASHSLVLSRPLTTKERSQLTQLDALRLFLLTGPAKWGTVSSSSAALSTPPALHRFPLPGGEPVSCVRWRGLFYITGTDVVRALVFRFAAFGRPVRHMKKFEEGIFSDLRNLKPGQDATLEEPKVWVLQKHEGPRC
jgi:transcription factor STE12